MTSAYLGRDTICAPPAAARRAHANMLTRLQMHSSCASSHSTNPNSWHTPSHDFGSQSNADCMPVHARPANCLVAHCCAQRVACVVLRTKLYRDCRTVQQPGHPVHSSTLPVACPTQVIPCVTRSTTQRGRDGRSPSTHSQESRHPDDASPHASSDV